MTEEITINPSRMEVRGESPLPKAFAVLNMIDAARYAELAKLSAEIIDVEMKATLRCESD